MSAARLVSAVFPARYGAGAWIPAVLACAGFLVLEAALHSRHAAAPDLRPVLSGALWDAVYWAGYLLYLAPLALPGLRGEPGFLRRAFLGFGLQLALGTAWYGLGPEWSRLEPCLLVANAVFVCAFASGRLSWLRDSSAAAMVAALALASVATDRHDVLDVSVGAAIGWAAFRAASSSLLAVFSREDFGDAVRFQVANLWSVFVGAGPRFWDESYAAGHWTFLETGQQRARHYAIAGLLRERFPAGAKVLDVGCGLGTLHRVLGEGGAYLGLDVSAEAVEEARRAHGAGRARFRRADILDFDTAVRFDAVILNEMLYYLPLERVPEAARKAAGLAGNGGMVVVSMPRNPKVPAVWRLLEGLAAADIELEVRDPASGSSWTVRVYEAARLRGAGTVPVVPAAALRAEQAATAVCLAVGLAAGFYFLDSAAAGRAAAGLPAWRPETAWDSFIPFSAAWVWPYLLYFPLCLAPLLLAPVRSDVAIFRSTAHGFLLQFVAAFVVFLAVPSGVTLPVVPPDAGLSEAAVGLIHRLDPGFNVFPSLHVANAVYVACVVSRFTGVPGRAAAWATAAAVAASTVLVKQHYLADVPAGAALGLTAFVAAFSRPSRTAASVGRPWFRAAFASLLCGFPGAVGVALFGLSSAAGGLSALAASGLSRMGGPAFGWAFVCAASAAALLAVPSAVPGALLGAVFGTAAWRLAFWDQLVFLDDPRPLVRLRHQLEEALNVFWRSDPARWDRMYRRGQWDFLHDPELGTLYEAVAAALRRRFPQGARLVDLGCGNGALLPYLGGWHRGYLGLDFSPEAVSRCAALAGPFAGGEFLVGKVEEFDAFEGFSAAVFNEVLYYLPAARAEAVVRRAAAGLPISGIVVVVMTDNPKARRIWRRLEAWRAPLERRLFRALPNEPLCELRVYRAGP
jgi:SAM-dependent methyltransferase